MNYCINKRSFKLKNYRKIIVIVFHLNFNYLLWTITKTFFHICCRYIDTFLSKRSSMSSIMHENQLIKDLKFKNICMSFLMCLTKLKFRKLETCLRGKRFLTYLPIKIGRGKTSFVGFEYEMRQKPDRKN